MLATTLFLLAIAIIAKSLADQDQAIDIIPQDITPIADQEATYQIDAIFARIHQLAVECGSQMRARHCRDEEDYLSVVRRVGVLGNFGEISSGRYSWALDFVNYVEGMVGHKKKVTDLIFSELEQRLQLSESTTNSLQQLHQQSGNVLNAILLKCRHQVTSTILNAIRVQKQLHLAAVQSCRLETDIQQWQLALEENVLRVSEDLRQISEENLQQGYILLDQFDRIYRQIVAENYI